MRLLPHYRTKEARFSKIAGLRINHAAVEHALAALGISAAVAGDDRLLVAIGNHEVMGSWRQSPLGTARRMRAAS